MPVGVGVGARLYWTDLSAADRWMRAVWDAKAGGERKVMAGHKARVMRGRLCF